MRNITLDLSHSRCHSPVVFAGYDGEHNATELTVILPDEIALSAQITELTPKCRLVDESVVSLDIIDFNRIQNKSINFLLPKDVICQGRVLIQIEAKNLENTLLLKSNVGILMFDPSVNNAGGTE